MRLKRDFLQTDANAAVNYVQVGYRRDAVDYALAGIRRHHDAVVNASNHDLIILEFEKSMHDWVAETLIQGVFIREYHLWEKDCKSYLENMAKRNGKKLPKKKSDESFTSWVWDRLKSFNAESSQENIKTIESMRVKTNDMKHEVGFEIAHLVSENEYKVAITAIEGFWNHLASEEVVGP